MGRHGKNLPLQAPIAKPGLGLAEISALLTDYEKQCLTNEAKNKMYEQAVASCLAVCARILVYHYDDIADVSERLKVFYGLFLRYHAQLDNPDIKQQFAEWYWESTTGYELMRSNEERERKMAKKYLKEICDGLKAYIDAQCFAMQDILQAANISKGTYNNVIYAGPCSKKSFDRVANYVGYEMDADMKAKYNECFGVGNRQRDERYEQMEDMAAEIESVVPVVASVDTEPAEGTADTPEPVEPPKMPVDENLQASVDAVIANEELPFTDCNEMYKEAVVETVPEPEPQSILELMRVKYESHKTRITEITDKLGTLYAEIEALNKELEPIDKEAVKLKKCIEIMEVD